MIELKLKEYMEEKEISTMFVHEFTGIRYATLIDIIHGHRKSINLEYLGKIMSALRINDVGLIMKKKKDAHL